MTRRNRLRNRSLAGIATLALFGSTANACSDPPIKNERPPAGVLRGEFLYQGPPPCTEHGHVVGAAILLVFDQRLLPPPDGLATRSVAIKVIAGDALFAEALNSLGQAPDGSRVCPAAGASPLAASAPWDLSPLEAGNYQIRAFYDYDGTFQPAFQYSDLPTQGDITGGALDNAVAASQGARPVFTNIAVGAPAASGLPNTRVMPNDGVLVDNLTVAVALPAAFQRPYFHVGSVQAGQASPSNAVPSPVLSPSQIIMPVDHHVTDASPFSAQPYLWVMRLDAGVLPSERAAALSPPFFMHVDAPGKLPVFWFDANGDGVVNLAGDHVLGSTLARSVAPVVTLTKLDPKDPFMRAVQATPRVLSAAITMNSAQLVDLATTFAATEPVLQDSVWAAVRPTAVCLQDASDANGDTVIVTPFALDQKGAPTVADEALLKADVAQLLHRRADHVSIVYACLPPGDFAINVIQVSGQAWTVPNETGVCMQGEADVAPVGNGASPICGTRAKLLSQSTRFTFGPANAPGACASTYNQLTSDDKLRYRTACLRPDEQTKLDGNILWN